MSTKQLRCGAFTANEEKIKMPPELAGKIGGVDRNALKKLIGDKTVKKVIIPVGLAIKENNDREQQESEIGD